jgi:hypothetical protein
VIDSQPSDSFPANIQTVYVPVTVASNEIGANSSRRFDKALAVSEAEDRPHSSPDGERIIASTVTIDLSGLPLNSMATDHSRRAGTEASIRKGGRICVLIEVLMPPV